MKFVLLMMVSVLVLEHIGNNGADARRRFSFGRSAIFSGEK